MRFIEPSVELLKQGDTTSHVARCARICYDKETGNNDGRLIRNLIDNKHWSVFRHVSYYAIVKDSSRLQEELVAYRDCPYIRYNTYGGKVYLATNGNFMHDASIRDIFIYHLIWDNIVSPEEFANTEAGFYLMRYTFKVTTQISTSRELNRTSPNNITEMSSRYVNLKDGAICRPHWFSKETANKLNESSTYDCTLAEWNYYLICEDCFETYNTLIRQGVKKQDARGVLPLDTATKVIYTYNWPEWKHIIELRTDKRAHVNCQIIANMIKTELEQLGYDFK